MRMSDWSSDVCSSDLNPFSMIDEELAATDEDYLLDCMAMLKAIVNQMSRRIDRLNDTERGLIDRAVNSVWAELGRRGSRAEARRGGKECVRECATRGSRVPHKKKSLSDTNRPQ